MIFWLTSLSVILMIVAPVFLAAWLRRRSPVPWLLFCAGMLTFAASQAVHLPLNEFLSDIGWMPAPGTSDVPLWRIALLAGLTAGLCEELARVGGYWLLRRSRSATDGIMLGLGHGGIEAMVFGGVLTAATVSALLPLAGQDLAQMGLPPEQISAVQQQIDALLGSPWSVFAPLLERLIAMGVHVTLSLMVLQAFQRRRPGWVALAILYHALIDVLAVLATGGPETPNTWAVLGGFLLIATPGWIWAILHVRKAGLPAAAPAQPLRSELRLFWVTVQKEMLQQWRTRRVLIIAAVFSVFGMVSPLMAYFMPQMMKAIPGAEQFASLIPDPTINDALLQYTKNISQFGFLLAILIGIGDVAGEKERGTASMILSKPLARWAFVSSKYLAQISLYLLGFLLSLAGSFIYAYVLFAPTDATLLFKILALASGLLFIWLIPFVTITLLGSVLANSTSAAAGIAAGGAVLLMLLGSIPQLSGILPGALLTWANQLSLAQPLPAVNGGALAASLVIAVAGLVISIAVFEKQEL